MAVISEVQSKENACLICGDPVERGLIKDYKGIKVLICTSCILEGELGSLMATTILDRPQVDKLQTSSHHRSEVWGEIERCVVTTQANFYRTLLHYIFHQFPVKERKGAHIQEPETKKEFLEGENETREFLDEREVLDFLDRWKTIEDIRYHFEVPHKPLLEMLNKLFLRGYILKRGSPQNPEYCNSLLIT